MTPGKRAATALIARITISLFGITRPASQRRTTSNPANPNAKTRGKIQAQANQSSRVRGGNGSDSVIVERFRSFSHLYLLGSPDGTRKLLRLLPEMQWRRLITEGVEKAKLGSVYKNVKIEKTRNHPTKKLRNQSFYDFSPPRQDYSASAPKPHS